MTSHKLRGSLCASLLLFIAQNAFAEEETDYEAPSQFEKAFYDEGKLNFNTSLYIRHRAVKDPTTGKYGLGPAGIQNQTGNVAISYISGYYKDVIGFDFWGNANIKLGHTVGQSEILYYDYECGQPGKFSPCEKSYISASVAALKLNLGDAGTNFKLAAGYTPINSGTVKSSWGLNPHAFRGFDSALTIDKLQLTYAWADRFKNDWSRDFKPMTTAWHQNNAAGLDNNGKIIKAGEIIDYIHTVGAVYNFGNTVLDVGYGEGKGYRRNWQALVERNDALTKSLSLQSKLFYQGARYIEDLSKIKDPSTEYYAGIGFNLIYNNTVWSLGYSQNSAPNTGYYNFRLTPWANSDKRDYQPTNSELGDSNAAGAKVIHLGETYNLKELNLENIDVGFSTTYGWHIVSDTNKKKTERKYKGEMLTLDLIFKYRISNALKLSIYPSLYRSYNSNYKTNRNDL
ncbi:porin, partial [Salmonella enterica]|nr:porin [Salmonella enterica]